MIDAPLPHALSEKKAFIIVVCFLLPPTILEQSYRFRQLITLAEEIHRADGAQDAPISSDAHPSIMSYERRAANLSVRFPEQ